MATIRFFGPTTERASKAVVIIEDEPEGEFLVITESWHSENSDVRTDDEIANQIVAFVRGNDVLTVMMSGYVAGCPHEEGIDYPEGESCPECPYWRDRG